MKTRAKRLARSTRRRSFVRPTTMQVAAICYRRSQFSIEFLLVNTSSGKWTFPKGRISQEMSPWEAAEQEALEEAGMPPGVVNFLPGSGALVGDVLVMHPRTRYVAFTGSK